MKEVQMLMVGGICSIFVFEVVFQQIFHIRKHSVRKNIYDGVYFRKVTNLRCTECNSAIYGLQHRKFLEQVPIICFLEKNILTKKSMVYQNFNNKDATLPKRELMLDLVEKPPWWKLFSIKSRVYPRNFIKSGLQLRGFLPLVLQDSSF